MLEGDAAKSPIAAPIGLGGGYARALIAAFRPHIADGNVPPWLSSQRRTSTTNSPQTIT